MAFAGKDDLEKPALAGGTGNDERSGDGRAGEGGGGRCEIQAATGEAIVVARKAAALEEWLHFLKKVIFPGGGSAKLSMLAGRKSQREECDRGQILWDGRALLHVHNDPTGGRVLLCPY